MKKSLMTRLTAFIAAMCLIIAACPFLTACGPKDKPQVETLTVRDITLDTSEAKTEFAYGEEFTAEGLKVTATLSDGSTRDIPLKNCRISKVNNTPGKRKVSVTYARKTKRYEVVFLDKPMPPISETSLLDIEGANVYRVEAEAIDLAVSGVKSADGSAALTGADAQDNEYIANYGVAENYFGFTFTADQDYANTTAVLRVASPSTENALYFGGDMSVHLNYNGSADSGSLGIINSVAIPKSAEGTPAWVDFALRGLNIKEGANTLTFSVLGENVPYIDYVDFYIGGEFSNSEVTLEAAGGKAIVDFEDLGFEKAVTREDYMTTYGLSTGEVCVLPNAQANDGSAVYALMNGEATTLITAEQNSTVQIIVNAASHIDWRFARDAEVKLDGELITINEQNLRAGTESEVVWKTTSLGFFDLAAGKHLLDIKINSPHAKFDSVTIKTLSAGDYVEHPEVYLDEVGTEIMEGEHLDSSDVVVRQDYSELVIGATHGKYQIRKQENASGKRYIDGFTGFPDASKNPYNPGTVEKTTFTVKFYLAADATVEVNAVVCSTLGVNLAKNEQVLVNIDGEKCAPAPCNLAQYHKGDGEYDDPRWVDTLIAKKNLQAGMHTFTIDVLNFFFDLDCFKFKAVTMGEYVPDVDIILDGTTEQQFEAEAITRGDIVLQSGVTPTDGYKFHVYTGSGSSGNLFIGGFGQGNKLYVKFNLEKATTYKILISVKASLPVAIWKYEGHPAGDSPHCDFYMDKGATNETHFMPPDAANGNTTMTTSWQELIISKNISLESGTHTLTILMSKYVFDIDYIKFVPVP